MKTASQLAKGVSSIRASVVRAGHIQQDIAARKNVEMVKWDGLSKLSNFEFSKDGVRVWKAFNMGPGKFLEWSDLNPSVHYGKFIPSTEGQLESGQTIPWVVISNNPEVRVKDTEQS